MRGGVKFYRGAPRGARDYVEAGRVRADDYYLAEGTGLAARYVATGEGAVERLTDLSGESYELWVAGADPDTGQVRGRVRPDANGVRFAEVVVNGPKSWSIAAEMHEDVAAAYEAAQDAAAGQIIGWLGAHLTTRVGPRGAQVSTPVERLEAVVVRHYTSRAGDPHRHLHVQINARVLAAGKWRGVDTVAVRQVLAGVHGIGHAAVMCDPGFRQALATHGYTLDADTGEIRQLSKLVPAVSRRTAQIAGQVQAYEAQWRAEHPGRTPGPGLRRVWDGRAWADGRPAKAPAGGVQPGRVVNGRWAAELAGLGFVPPAGPVPVGGVPVGQVDRDRAADEVLARLGAARSAFNCADVRGGVEELIARAGVVAGPGVRAGLAADITARARARCVDLLPGRAVPEHVRALTTREVINIEQDITGRLAVRGALGGVDATAESVAAAAAVVGASLDVAQEQAVAALAGDHALVVVSGAAGAGKTTVLAAARTAVEAGGHRLVVVAPTLKAARAARVQTGAAASSAAKLAHAYGWRWDETGRWSRLAVGETDPNTGGVFAGPAQDLRLAAGDVLVVDEAGMCGQDTARALLHVADEAGARVALIGDTRQLAAVGRGGVLDIAARHTARTVGLDVIHRFTRTEETAPGVVADVPDTGYAELSLAMRTGENPAAVFDGLAGGGHVRLHHDEQALNECLAGEAVTARRAGRRVAVAADTRERAAELNAAIRAGMITAGLVDDTHTVPAAAGGGVGQVIGVGDVVATRRNNKDLGVANRDVFTVTAIYAGGGITVRPAGQARHGRAGADNTRHLPASYVAAHVELGYASTVHGVQGDTTDTGHVVLSEGTGAAAAYVGMTRGRQANTAHVIADNLEQAKALWVAAAGRGRADTGVQAAAAAASREAARYAGVADRLDRAEQQEQARLAAVLDGLRAAWDEQTAAQTDLDRASAAVNRLHGRAEFYEKARAQTEPQRHAAQVAEAAAEQAKTQAEAARDAIAAHTAALHGQLRADWERDRPAAAQAAAIVAAGPPGRLGALTGQRRAYQQARTDLALWAGTWRQVIPGLGAWPAVVTDYTEQPAGPDSRADPALARYAADLAVKGMPDAQNIIDAQPAAARAAADARHAYQQAWRATGWDTAQLMDEITPGRPTLDQLPAWQTRQEAAQQTLADANARIDQLTADPAITGLDDPDRWLTQAHDGWTADRVQKRQARARAAARQERARTVEAAAHREYTSHYQPPSPDRGRGPGIGR